MDHLRHRLPDDQAHSVTVLLRRWNEGESTARDELITLLYNELRQMARHIRARRDHGDNTLSTTELLHDGWLEIQGGRFENRRHFFGAAAQAMRRLLVDHARALMAAKRNYGVAPEPLRDDSAIQDESLSPLDRIALDDALTRLQADEPEHHEVIMLRHYAGLRYDVIAELIGRDERTVRSYAQRSAQRLRELMRQEPLT